MPHLRKYGTADTIDGVPLITRNACDFKANPTLAAGDVLVEKDGGTAANITTLPTVTPTGGPSVQIALSSGELTAKRVTVRFVDQTSPKEWEDQEVIVETYGHASAQLVFDLGTALTPQTIWDAATSVLTTAGSIGKWILDKLDVVLSSRSSSTEVTSIQNNTRVVRVVPTVFERPGSGSTVFRVELLCYDDVGNMEVPDSAPTISVVNQGGTSRDANLDSTTMTLVSTGRYRSTYTVSSAHALEQLVFAFSVVEGAATRAYANTGTVLDTTAEWDGTLARGTVAASIDSMHTQLDSGALTGYPQVYQYERLVFTAGNGSLQSTIITSYDQTTRICTHGDLGTLLPNTSSSWVIVPAKHELALSSLATGGDLATLAASIPVLLLASGTVAASIDATHTQLDSNVLATANRYVGSRLVLTSGTGHSQEEIITGFSSGRVATHAAWVVLPDATTLYEIHEAKVHADLSSNFTVTPVISMVLPAGELVSQAISIAQYETKAMTFVVLDQDEEPINDAGDAFKLVVYKTDKVTVVFQTTGTAGGVSGNQVPIVIADTKTATAGTYYYRLWNVTKDTVRAENSFEIRQGAQAT